MEEVCEMDLEYYQNELIKLSFQTNTLQLNLLFSEFKTTQNKISTLVSSNILDLNKETSRDFLLYASINWDVWKLT